MDERSIDRPATQRDAVAVKRIALIVFVALISLGCTAARPKSRSPFRPYRQGAASSLCPSASFRAKRPRHSRRTTTIQHGSRILPSLTLPRTAYDTTRRQVVAERVLDAVAATYRQGATRGPS